MNTLCLVPGTGLLTDLYQLTMAYGYWKAGTAEKEAGFHLFFRRNPFQGGYTVACGLADALDFLQRIKFEDGDLEYLATIKAQTLDASRCEVTNSICQTDIKRLSRLANSRGKGWPQDPAAQTPY